MEEENDKIHLQEVIGDDDDVENLIEFSSENDALFFDSSSPLSVISGALSHLTLHQSSSEHQEEPRNSDSPLNAGKESGITPRSDQDEQLPDPTESSEPEKAGRMKRCNLRKSLAWDSAFFTNAGVLNAEELSSMIKGSVKSESQTLPGIQEDVRGSNDSKSTLESDNLENFEAELFGDIRASIQKSSMAFNATSGNGKAAFGERQLNSPLMKMALASEDQVKQKNALKKPNSTLKSQTKQTLGVKGSLKAVKQDSVHSRVKQSVVRTGASVATVPKPPRVTSKGKGISTAAAKRAFIDATQQNKIENQKTRIAASRGVQAPKGPIPNGAHRLLPKPASSLKSSSLSSSKSTKTESAQYSLDSSASVSSNRSGKSPLAAARRKVGDRTAKPPSCGSNKTPLKTAVKNRISANSTLSAYLMSSKKISSNISPASSISELSSASSTSSPIIKRRSSNLRTSFETSSCRSLDTENLHSDLENHSNNQISDGHDNDSTREASRQTSTLSQPGSGKPSGLRLPSPKIGFFDGAKSVRTPNGRTTQSHRGVPPALPKSKDVRTPQRSSNMKTKTDQPRQAGNLSAFRSVKPVIRKSSSPLSSEEKSRPLGNISSAAGDVKVGST